MAKSGVNKFNGWDSPHLKDTISVNKFSGWENSPTKGFVDDRRPYKIWNVNREIRKAIMAASIEDLFDQIYTKFEIPRVKKITLVLEMNGSEVRDDTYFKSLDDNTKFIFLVDTEKWSKFDIIEERSAKNLVNALIKNLDFFYELTDDDLMTLSNMDEYSVSESLLVHIILVQEIKNKSRSEITERGKAKIALKMLEELKEIWE